MVVDLTDLPKLAGDNPHFNSGCIVDTNVLFAASFPLDQHNEWAEKLFESLGELGIPTFTNLNIRSEFIELNRRVLIPEGLVDFYEDLAPRLDGLISAKLKSLKTRKESAAKALRTFKLSDSEIKDFRQLLGSYIHTTGQNGWTLFCRDYFGPYIHNIWEDLVEDTDLQFLGTREIEVGTYFFKSPSWNDMMTLVARYGLGSSDAMIINLFVNEPPDAGCQINYRIRNFGS